MRLLERWLAGIGIGHLGGDSCGSADIMQQLEQFTVGVEHRIGLLPEEPRLPQAAGLVMAACRPGLVRGVPDLR